MSVQRVAPEKQSIASGASGTATAAALAALIWAAGLVDLFLLPPAGETFVTTADYADPVIFLLGIILSAVALTGLQRRQEVRAGRLGQVGYWLIMAAFALLAVQTSIELIVGGEALGPLFPIGSLASRLSFILWAIATYRAGILPRWLGPALALAWFIFPPLGPTVAAFALPVAWAAAALAIWRPTATTD